MTASPVGDGGGTSVGARIDVPIPCRDARLVPCMFPCCSFLGSGGVSFDLFGSTSRGDLSQEKPSKKQVVSGLLTEVVRAAWYGALGTWLVLQVATRTLFCSDVAWHKKKMNTLYAD